MSVGDRVIVWDKDRERTGVIAGTPRNGSVRVRLDVPISREPLYEKNFLERHMAPEDSPDQLKLQLQEHKAL